MWFNVYGNTEVGAKVSTWAPSGIEKYVHRRFANDDKSKCISVMGHDSLSGRNVMSMLTRREYVDNPLYR